MVTLHNTHPWQRPTFTLNHSLTPTVPLLHMFHFPYKRLLLLLTNHLPLHTYSIIATMPLYLLYHMLFPDPWMPHIHPYASPKNFSLKHLTVKIWSAHPRPSLKPLCSSSIAPFISFLTLFITTLPYNFPGTEETYSPIILALFFEFFHTLPYIYKGTITALCQSLDY